MNSFSNKRFQLLILIISLASGIIIGFATKDIDFYLAVFIIFLAAIPFFFDFHNLKHIDFFEPSIIVSATYVIHFSMPVLLAEYIPIRFHFYEYGYVSLTKTLGFIILSLLMYYIGYYLFSSQKIIDSYLSTLKECRGTWDKGKVYFIGIVTILFVALLMGGFLAQYGGSAAYERVIKGGIGLFRGQGYLLASRFLVAPAFLGSLIVYLEHRKKRIFETIFIVIFFAFTIIFMFITGRRVYLVGCLLLTLVVWNYKHKKIGLRQISIFLLVSFIFSVFYVALVRGSSYFDISNTRTINVQVKNILTDVMSRGTLTELYTFGDIVNKFPERMNFQYGKTFLSLLTMPLPRSIFPNKLPEIGELFTRTFYPDYFLITSFGIPAIGELYINFGVFGILFGMLFLGVITKNIYQILLTKRDNVWILAYSIFIFWLYLYITRSLVISSVFGIINIGYGMVISFIAGSNKSINNKNFSSLNSLNMDMKTGFQDKP